MLDLFPILGNGLVCKCAKRMLRWVFVGKGHIWLMIANKAQEKVIKTIEGQLIVIACPGSGKTTTLVRRIHHMVEDCGIDSSHILMITFTNAAAKEMKERYEKMYGQDEVTFCTIHSLCLAILKKFCGITNANILSNPQDFFYQVLKENKRINDKTEFIKLLITDISVVKNNGLSLTKYEPQCCNDKKLFQQMYEQYENYKEQYHLIDFDDMLLKAYQCMQENSECLTWLREKYQYIQVDEFQDTNFLQRDLIFLLAGEYGNLAVVGDDDQSIYGFRGARPEVMLRFQDFYPNVAFVRMNTNYRSCSGIIEAADQLIQSNTSRFEKEFKAFHEEKGTVRRYVSKNRAEEVLRVATIIQELIQNGEEPSEIAILYRTNQQAELVADTLMNLKIPFVSTEKIPSRYQHWMFEDIKSYRRLAENCNWTQQDLFRVLNHPCRYLYDYKYIQAGLDMKKMRQIAYQLNSAQWKRKNATESVTEFFYALSQMQGKNPVDFLKNMKQHADYIKYLREYAKFRNADDSEFTNIWKKYEEDAKKYNDWNEWNNYIIQYNHATVAAKEKKEGVRLSTMHGAKGLEWKHVFIIDCIDGMCPYTKATSDSEVEEERRLFYVAMTRAKEHLYFCSYRENNGKTVKQSPFVVQKNFVKRKKPVREKARSTCKKKGL